MLTKRLTGAGTGAGAATGAGAGAGAGAGGAGAGGGAQANSRPVSDKTASFRIIALLPLEEKVLLNVRALNDRLE
jgi:hypothetical protein